MATPSLRLLWTLYKRVAVEHDTNSRRDLLLIQDAFYPGARGVLKVLEHLVKQGKQEDLQRDHPAARAADRQDSRTPLGAAALETLPRETRDTVRQQRLAYARAHANPRDRRYRRRVPLRRDLGIRAGGRTGEGGLHLPRTPSPIVWWMAR